MKQRNAGLVICFSVFLVFLSCSGEQEVTVTAPGGACRVVIKTHSLSGEAGSGPILSYRVMAEEDVVIEESPIQLIFHGMEPMGPAMMITGSDTRIIDQTWERTWGKSRVVRDHCHETTIQLQETMRPGRRLDLIVRAYDDGIAFRYRIPEQEGVDGFELKEEKTAFRFNNDCEVWATSHGSFTTNQEHHFDQIHLTDIAADDVIGTPLLVKVGEGLWTAIMEASLRDWAGMALGGSENGTPEVRTRLAPLPGEPDVAVRSAAPRESPWRVIMIAGHPNRMIESDLLHNLNEPCAIDDVSWIKPGKSAWDWWWSDGYAPDQGRKLGPDTEGEKYFIDFAAEMGWEYQLVDWNWYGAPFLSMDTWETDMSLDITQPAPYCDIHEIIRHAKERGVKTLVWLEWRHAKRQMKEAFPLYEKWGIAGVKVDFFDRMDQQMVNFCHELIQLAAKHHLVVDFHGAYMPTGISRTWPNFLTREGVLGNEYNKWSELVTLDHCLTLPYTRMLGGHMDFTPGGFMHGTRETFKVADQVGLPYPMVRGTRCHQLAMMVVYESALQVICDSPYNYRQSPSGLDFLKLVPTTWDETIVLDGEVGDYIVVARRSGEDWYIGAMTDWDPRVVDIEFDFLAEGAYSLTLWEDAPDADIHPEKLEKKVLQATSGSSGSFELAPGGGMVMHIQP